MVVNVMPWTNLEIHVLLFAGDASGDTTSVSLPQLLLNRAPGLPVSSLLPGQTRQEVYNRKEMKKIYFCCSQ